MDSSQSFFLTIEENKLKQSVTISLNKQQDIPFFQDRLLSGVSIDIYSSNIKQLDLYSFDEQVAIMLYYKTDKIDENVLVYAKDKNDTWRLISKAIWVEEQQIYKLQAPHNGFSTFAFVKEDKYKYKKTFYCQDSYERALNNCIVLSSTNYAIGKYDGIVNFKDYEKPNALVVYKKGYIPQKISYDENITLQPFELNISKNIYFDIEKYPHFYTGDDNHRFYVNSFDILPKFLSTISQPIYSEPLKFDNKILIASADGIIYEVKEENLTIYDDRFKGNALYNSFYTNQDFLVWATLNSNIAICKKDDNCYNDIANAQAILPNFIDKAIVINNYLYLPVYNNSQTKIVSMNLEYIDYEMIVLEYYKNSSYQSIGKLANINDKLTFGTNNGQLVIFSDENNQTTIETNLTNIIATPIFLDNKYFIIDTNGTLASISNNEVINTIHLSKALNILVIDNMLLIPTTNGKIYKIDTNLNNLQLLYDLNEPILAKPIIYNDVIYTITKNGIFYKNNQKIGFFNSKVVSMSLIDGKIIIGNEDREVWEIKID